MKKHGQLNAYSEEIHKLIEQGYAREFDESDIREWTGQFNYVAHHRIQKPGFVTTLLRIEVNPTLSSLYDAEKTMNEEAHMRRFV